VDRSDFGEASEVRVVECQKALHRVDLHDRDEAGVVNLNALDAVSGDQKFPDGIDLWDVGEQAQRLFDGRSFLQG
jgi:hypothetical protein